jgi:hypothetical protein
MDGWIIPVILQDFKNNSVMAINLSKPVRFSGHIFVASVLMMFSMSRASGQNSLITLVDSTKVKTDIITVSERTLFAGAGSFNLTEVYSVQFLTEEEYRKRISSVAKLLDYGVIVYVMDKKQTPSDPVKVAANKKLTEERKSAGAGSANVDESKLPTEVSGGFGIGQDYGGFGARLTVLPTKHLGLFFGGGYALAGFGYNVGAMAIANPDNRVSPTFSFMYGYTAAIAVSGASQYNKLYYGPSIGFGLRSKSRRNEGNYWQFGLTIPFRPSEFDTDFNALKNNPNITGLTKPLPVTISIGYHFIF